MVNIVSATALMMSGPAGLQIMYRAPCMNSVWMGRYVSAAINNVLPGSAYKAVVGNVCTQQHRSKGVFRAWFQALELVDEDRDGARRFLADCLGESDTHPVGQDMISRVGFADYAENGRFFTSIRAPGGYVDRFRQSCQCWREAGLKTNPLEAGRTICPRYLKDVWNLGL